MRWFCDYTDQQSRLWISWHTHSYTAPRRISDHFVFALKIVLHKLNKFIMPLRRCSLFCFWDQFFFSSRHKWRIEWTYICVCAAAWAAIATAFDDTSNTHTNTHLVVLLAIFVLFGPSLKATGNVQRTHPSFQFRFFLHLSFEANRFKRLIVINLLHLWLNSFLFSIKRQRATSFVIAAHTAKVGNSSDGGGGISRVRSLHSPPHAYRIIALFPSIMIPFTYEMIRICSSI